MTVGFKLRRPCPKCPFRLDVEPYLRHGRAAGIARSLADGADFPCHETVDYDDDGEPITGDQFCAGALIAMEHSNTPNQIVRIAERLGEYDPSKLDMEAPVGTLSDFQDHNDEEPDADEEFCDVADADCLAAAGWMVNGVVVHGTHPGPVTGCPNCGTMVCENCRCDCEDDA